MARFELTAAPPIQAEAPPAVAEEAYGSMWEPYLERARLLQTVAKQLRSAAEEVEAGSLSITKRMRVLISPMSALWEVRGARWVRLVQSISNSKLLCLCRRSANLHSGKPMAERRSLTRFNFQPYLTSE